MSLAYSLRSRARGRASTSIQASRPVLYLLVRFFSSLARFAPSAAALAWLLGSLGPCESRAHAQPMGEVVVVPFGVPDLTAPLHVTSLLEAELLNERVSLIPLHDARDRFTARSRPPQTASDSDLDVLAREARQAIEHVAFGRTAAAQKSVREVIARAEKTLESLNRETATARHILDACLSLVRGALQAGRRDLALEQATRCRRLVPDLVPSEQNHPANVVGVLAEADNMLRRMRIGALAVRSTPESNCSVYLNGRHLGTTPFQLDRAAAGDYRAQVECGRSAGRVHVVQLGDQAVSLLVDTQFDRTVASDPRLLLRYENRERAREQGVSHAVQIGREIHADDVLLVGVHHDRAEILRVSVAQQRLIARASVPWTQRNGFARPALEAAIVALSEGRFEGEPSLEKTASAPTPPAAVVEPKPEPEPEPAVPEPPPAPAASAPVAPDEQVAPEPVVQEPEVEPTPALSAHDRLARRQRRVRIAGYTLVGVSATMFVVGIAYHARTQNLLNQLSQLGTPGPMDGEDPTPDASPDDAATASKLAHLQPQYEHASNLRWIGVAGGVLGTAATALLVEPRASVPWWGYVIAAGGVGLGVVGGIELAQDHKCDLRYEGQCRRPHDSAALGGMLLSAAVPLLSVPLLQWLKPKRERSLALSSSPILGGLQLQLHARY